MKMTTTTTTYKDNMIYTVILYFVILNLVLAVLIHFCQLQYFISKNILIFVKGFSYEHFIKIRVIPVVVVVIVCNTLSTHQGSVFVNNVVTKCIVMIFTKVRSIKLLILCTFLALLVITNFICLSRCQVFFCSVMPSDSMHSECRGVFIFTVI